MNITNQSQSKLSYFTKALSDHQNSRSRICKFCSHGDKIKNERERVNVFFFFFPEVHLCIIWKPTRRERSVGEKKANKLTPNSIYWIGFSYIKPLKKKKEETPQHSMAIYYYMIKQLISLHPGSSCKTLLCLHGLWMVALQLLVQFLRWLLSGLLPPTSTPSASATATASPTATMRKTSTSPSTVIELVVDC